MSVGPGWPSSRSARRTMGIVVAAAVAAAAGIVMETTRWRMCNANAACVCTWPEEEEGDDDEDGGEEGLAKEMYATADSGACTPPQIHMFSRWIS